ncbi:MAG: ribulokinase, partial [Oscillospiraceae bacterium]
SPYIYDEMARFIEATDWVVWQLTGNETRNSCTAGYKSMWNKESGYPSNDFFKALHPKLENLVDEKLTKTVIPVGSKAGEINIAASKLTGLNVGTPVAVGNVDAHVAVPGVGITSSEKMLMIMGTSTCHMLIGDEKRIVPGMCGVVEDGILPGFQGYEAGQSCVGDHFDWFIKNCVPNDYFIEANNLNINIHKLLREKAKKFNVGESGLVALDWWNGNRSVLVDSDLTGVVVGLTLLTKPEEIYRALIEATAYGTRMIIETFINFGVPINELYACGGIAQKDELMMQIYADVTNKTIKISSSSQTPALGSAMFGAVVGGYFKNITDASKTIARIDEKIYIPISENVRIYDELYSEYKQLHDYFGRGENNILKRLKEIKKGANL